LINKIIRYNLIYSFLKLEFCEITLGLIEQLPKLYIPDELKIAYESTD